MLPTAHAHPNHRGSASSRSSRAVPTLATGPKSVLGPPQVSSTLGVIDLGHARGGDCCIFDSSYLGGEHQEDVGGREHGHDSEPGSPGTGPSGLGQPRQSTDADARQDDEQREEVAQVVRWRRRSTREPGSRATVVPTSAGMSAIVGPRRRVPRTTAMPPTTASTQSNGIIVGTLTVSPKTWTPNSSVGIFGGEPDVRPLRVEMERVGTEVSEQRGGDDPNVEERIRGCARSPSAGSEPSSRRRTRCTGPRRNGTSRSSPRSKVSTGTTAPTPRRRARRRPSFFVSRRRTCLWSGTGSLPERADRGAERQERESDRRPQTDRGSGEHREGREQ